jgi:hypothetical protein
MATVTARTRFLVLASGVALLWGVAFHLWAGGAQAAPQTCRKGFFPASGQTTCWNSVGGVIPCFGSDQDGDIQAGATLRYQDNGDGTITDLNTGLMWEKKSDDGTIHDKDNTYLWDFAFTVHVAGLNAANFAGYQDWRLPNVKELQSIVDYEHQAPAVAPGGPFSDNCVAGCTVRTCSCTGLGAQGSGFYWSSTTFLPDPFFAWEVDFAVAGDVNAGNKFSLFGVRAVRGGCVD